LELFASKDLLLDDETSSLAMVFCLESLSKTRFYDGINLLCLEETASGEDLYLAFYGLFSEEASVLVDDYGEL
jgi:hypothetical protein